MQFLAGDPSTTEDPRPGWRKTRPHVATYYSLGADAHVGTLVRDWHYLIGALQRNTLKGAASGNI
jgi:hypothetical protein